MVTRRRGLLGVIATGLAAILFPGKSAGASAAFQGLEGTWISLEESGDAGRASRVHATYSSDGTVIITSTGFPAVSPAQGVWIRTDDRQVLQTSVSLRFDDRGNWVGTQKVRAAIRLNETLDEYISTSVSEQLDQQGNVVRTLQGIRRATRMRPEPLA
jgi:hypothetical protein